MAILAATLTISARDLRIVNAARRKLAAGHVGFEDAVRALAEAVAEDITGGRIYYLGEGVVGSLVSGVGIVDGPNGVILVRHDQRLGRFV